MTERSAGRTFLASSALVAGGAALALAATGRLTPWVHACESLASSVAASIAPPPATSPAADAGPLDGRAAPAAAPPPHRQTAPLSSAQLGAPLVHGTFVRPCGAPDNMKIVLEVTVKMGHAVKVVARTKPPDAAVAACLERAVHGLEWDVSPRTGHVTVTY